MPSGSDPGWGGQELPPTNDYPVGDLAPGSRDTCVPAAPLPKFVQPTKGPQRCQAECNAPRHATGRLSGKSDGGVALETGRSSGIFSGRSGLRVPETVMC